MYLGQEYYRRAKTKIRIRIIIYRIHNIHTCRSSKNRLKV
jgi:hypothetical protein